MADRALALTELQALLGADATDGALWHDLRQFEQTALPIIATIWQLDELDEQSL